MGYPKIRRDESVNAAYLALRPVGEGGVAKSVPVESKDGSVLMVIDFSVEGHVLGIEFLDAATQLPVPPDE